MDTLQQFCAVLAALMFILGTRHVLAQDDLTMSDDVSWSTDWSPDGQEVAIARANGTIQIFNAASENLVRSLTASTTAEIIAVTWNPTGSTIAAAAKDHAVYLWNASDGELTVTLNGENTDYVHDLAWDASGSLLAGVSQQDGRLQIWDAASGSLVVSERHGTLINVDWGHYGLISGADSAVALIDPSTGLFVKHLGFQSGIVTTVAWSPDGTLFATADVYGDISIVDAVTRQKRNEFTGHSLPVMSIDWHPDGSMIATVSLDNSLRIWDLARNELVQVIDEDAALLDVQWSPDGSSLLYSGDIAGLGSAVNIIPAPAPYALRT